MSQQPRTTATVSHTALNPGTPHHFIITVSLQDNQGRAIGALSHDGLVHWQPGETRQHQYLKVRQIIAHDLVQQGYSDRFVTTFWDLAPNQP